MLAGRIQERRVAGKLNPKSPPACGLSHGECGREPVSAMCIGARVDTCVLEAALARTSWTSIDELVLLR
jgi:hypothetical protein